MLGRQEEEIPTCGICSIDTVLLGLPSGKDFMHAC